MTPGSGVLESARDGSADMSATVQEAARKAPKELAHRLYRQYVMRRFDHTEGYRRLMKFRLKVFGPGHAVGGFDNNIGKLQFEFLREQGLEPSDRMLDIGCGTLRGGEHFMRYLDEGCYVGIDISQEAIDAGRRRFPNLVERADPEFYSNDDLRFREIDGLVDVALAQSVFTHLPERDIDECFTHLHDVLAPGGSLFATIFESDTTKVEHAKNFYYPVSKICELAQYRGLTVELLSMDDYPHPRGQRMLKIQLADD